MNRRAVHWFFVGVQIVGSACSIASFLRGLQLLVIDITNWTALVWLVVFIMLAAIAIMARRKASPLLVQSGREHGHGRTKQVEVFYPMPYKATPHLRLSRLHLKGTLGNPVTANALRNREVIAVEQRNDGFKAEIRGASGGISDGSYNWRFKWKAQGMPDYLGSFGTQGRATDRARLPRPKN